MDTANFVFLNSYKPFFGCVKMDPNKGPESNKDPVQQLNKHTGI